MAAFDIDTPSGNHSPALHWQALRNAFHSPDSIAERLRAEGQRVVRTIGLQLPRKLIIASGMVPVRIPCSPVMPTPQADAMVGGAGTNWQVRSVVEQVISSRALDAVVVAHDSETQVQIFGALREVFRSEAVHGRLLHFADHVPLEEPVYGDYNRTRTEKLCGWLQEASGAPVKEGAGASAAAALSRQRQVLEQLAQLRRGRQPRISGTQFLHAVGAAATLPIDTHVKIVEALLARQEDLAVIEGVPVMLCGSAHESDHYYRLIEDCGFVVTCEDHGWGEACWEESVPPSAAQLGWVDGHLPSTISSEHYANAVVSKALERQVFAVVHLVLPGDEVSPWRLAALRTALGCSGVKLIELRARPGIPQGDQQLGSELRAWRDGTSAALARPAKPSTDSKASIPTRPAGKGERSRKSLSSVTDFGAYQRNWFQEVRNRAASGEPFAVLNANAPQELFRAFGIPFVVNQWWASIVAAKQQTRRYAALLHEHGYPTNVEAYSAQGLAASFEEDPDNAPWGGLPKPSILAAVTSSDATRGIFQAWSSRTAAELLLFERTVESRVELPLAWWDDLVDRWDESLEAERLDLMTQELKQAIPVLERITGLTFESERLDHVMQLVNEQEQHYRDARDLIAATVPAPVSIVDTMPATMVPQWHRGTAWGRDAAKALYEEIAQRVASKQAACDGERLRLMWVGRGVWSDMGFYQRWERSHGAVFVWSMYLALAADGYLRHVPEGKDPLRALASRFLTMGDELRMPTWAGAWHVKEAISHQVDGAIAVQDADPFVIRALQQAGIPVLALGVDNFSQQEDGLETAVPRITEFIEGPVTSYAYRRTAV